MSLVWKLLRQHISIPQFLGFFFANLFGMSIVLLGFQFYRDIVPVFTSEDSFMKADYIILGKKIGAGNTISGRSVNTSYSPSDKEYRYVFEETSYLAWKFSSTIESDTT